LRIIVVVFLAQGKRNRSRQTLLVATCVVAAASVWASASVKCVAEALFCALRGALLACPEAVSSLVSLLGLKRLQYWSAAAMKAVNGVQFFSVSCPESDSRSGSFATVSVERAEGGGLCSFVLSDALRYAELRLVCRCFLSFRDIWNQVVINSSRFSFHVPVPWMLLSLMGFHAFCEHSLLMAMLCVHRRQLS
jgi:hypothetical protein